MISDLKIKDYILSVARDSQGNYNFLLFDEETRQLVYDGYDLVECVNKSKGL